MTAVDPNQIIRWSDGRAEVVARPIAAIARSRGAVRMILRDLTDGLHLAERDRAGKVVVIAGPITLAEALAAAEAVMAGHEHGSVQGAATRMAVGLLGLVVDTAAATEEASNEA